MSAFGLIDSPHGAGMHSARMRAVTRLAALGKPMDIITSFARREHRRLDAMLRRVRTEVEAGQMDEARASCDAFHRGLSLHATIEEQLFFPLFEARSGMVGGPTATLRHEHRELEAAARSMCEALSRDDRASFHEGLRLLEEVRPEHESKEEHVLYPTTDQMLSDRECAAVVERLERL